jgi:hypothetical protein
MPASSNNGNYDVVVQAYNANDSAFIQHTVTLTDHITGCNFFRIDEGATLVGGGFSITIDNDSSDNSFINNGTISGVLDVIITNPNGTSKFNGNGQGGNVRNLTANHSGTVITFDNETQILDGNLTVTEGAVTCLDSDGTTSCDLDVAGDILVENGGTLTGAAASIEARSLTVDSGGTYNATTGVTKIQGSRAADAYGLDLKDGTVNHNNGTFRYEGSGGTQLNFADSHLYNLEISVTGSSGSAITLQGDESNSVIINNNFTMENTSGQGMLVPIGSDGYEFTVRNNMYMKYYDRTTNENMQFGYNQTATGTWTVEGTLSLLNANEKVRIRATSGTFNLGGLINDGGRIDSQ